VGPAFNVSLAGLQQLHQSHDVRSKLKQEFQKEKFEKEKADNVVIDQTERKVISINKEEPKKQTGHSR
jgi:flagellar motor protein MotB